MCRALPEAWFISRNTAFTFKGKAVDVRHIGRELGVRYVLEGGRQAEVGPPIQVDEPLIKRGTGAHVWAEQMDVAHSTLATFQDNFGHREPTGTDAQC